MNAKRMIVSVALPFCLLVCAEPSPPRAAIKETERTTPIPREDVELYFETEESISILTARALETPKSGRGSVGVSQLFRVKETLFGYEFPNQMDFLGVKSDRHWTFHSSAGFEAAKIRKDSDIILFIKVEPWSDLGSRELFPQIRRVLPDTPKNRDRVNNLLRNLKTSVTAPLADWMGLEMEAVVTPDLKKLHAGGQSLANFKKDTQGLFLSSSVRWRDLDFSNTERIKQNFFAKFTDVEIQFRKARKPFRVLRASSGCCLFYPDHDKNDLLSGSESHGELACVLPVLFKLDKETSADWEERILQMVKNGEHKNAHGDAERFFDELSMFHGPEGIQVLKKIAAQLDSSAERYVEYLIK